MNVLFKGHIARTRWAGRAAALVAAACASVLLISCASSQGKTGTTQVTPTVKGSAVEVILKDYEIQMPESVPAGDVTFNVTNAGSHDHNFEIDLKGNKRRLDNDLKPGDSHTLTVSLTPGTYDVICPVSFHSTRGMRRKLTVTGPSAFIALAQTPQTPHPADRR